MRRRRYVKVAIGLAALVVLFAGAWKLRPHPAAPMPSSASSSSRPNVVLISIDTTRPDHLGCYGYGRNTSPNLDHLAREGVRFRQARSQAPLTLPSHMALFTSMLPSHNTVDHMEAVLPSSVPTLAQLLKAHGYHTAAFVNDGQMQARWGFNRGFDVWRESRALRKVGPCPGCTEGNCDQITSEALYWLGTRPAEPFFLFVHYYDPHAPYEPPVQYRKAFGSTLTAEQVHRFTQARRPEDTQYDRAVFEQAIGSYDGEIAWVDHELGRLLQQLPSNTLVAVFSDHGEPFKEHGWMCHGATLYEEDIRTALVLHHPTLLPRGFVVEEPVMLLDVMPTLLSLCGIQTPPHCEGTDLGPLWQGGQLPQCWQLAENKATFDGCAQKMAQLGEWKLIYSLFDGKRELYRLPDEQTERSRQDPVMAKALFTAIRGWMEQEDYWMLYARGQGTFTATLTPRDGQCTHLIQLGRYDAQRQQDVQEGPNKRWLRWALSPNGATRGLFFQVMPPESPLKVEWRIDGKEVLDRVFLGPGKKHPTAMPWTSIPVDDALAGPVVEEGFKAEADGFYLVHHRGNDRNRLSPVVSSLDEKTIKQLRSLNYLR